jgi:flagellar biosynthesis GTPase FlhF
VSTLQAPEPRTYRGKSLPEVLKHIRKELGEDAIALSVKEGTVGGFAGFFAKRCVLVEAIAAPRPGAGRDYALEDEPEFELPMPLDALTPPVAAKPEPKKAAKRFALRRQAAAEVAAAEPEPAKPSDLDVEFERILAAANAASAAAEEAPVAAPKVADSWEELMAQARRATAPRPPVAAPEPTASAAASALARLFAQDAKEPEVEVTPEPEVEPEPVVAENPNEPRLAVFPAYETIPDEEDEAEPALEAEAEIEAEDELPVATLLPDVVEPVLEAEATSVEVDFPAYVPNMEIVPFEAGWPELALQIHEDLTARGIDTDLVAEIVSEAVEHMAPFSRRPLRPLVADGLARCLTPLPRRRPGRLVIGFVGADGSGKTRCTSRLALAYARRGNRPVVCLTLRPEDRGAALRDAVGKAGIAVHAAADVASARRFLAEVGEHALVVVDTPSVTPGDKAELRRLGEELRQLQLDECHLTMPATLSPQDAGDLVADTRPLGVDALAITHVDATDHLGAAIGAAIDARLPISYLGRGAGRAELRPARPEALALELVG